MKTELYIPPPVLTPDFDAIEASGLPKIATSWCVWKAEPKEDGKFKKLPSNGKRTLSTNALDNWLTYDDAKAVYEKGGWQGIGLMPLTDDALVGLDADGVTEDTGGCLSGAGRDIVLSMERIGCYMERSPSGKGLRGFVLGVKPEGCKTKATKDGHSLECYQKNNERHDNYVTVTGHIWQGVNGKREAKPVEVVDGQALEGFLASVGLLNALVDAEAETKAAIEKASGKARTNGYDGEWTRRTDEAVLALLLGRLNPQGKYTRLMNGDIDTDYAGNVSEARFALLSQLAYITRDDEQIERIARISNLDASRFDEKRSGFRNRLHYDVMNALKGKDRNYDDDQANNAQVAEQKAEAVKSLKAKGALLHGGLDGLLGSTGKLIPGAITLSELLIRDPDLLGVMYFDEFAGMPMKSISFAEAFNDHCAPKTAGQLEDDDLLAVAAWARKKWGFLAEERSLRVDAVRRWARLNSINPITDKLQKFADEWDGKERLSSWLVHYLGCKAKTKDKEYYLSEVGKRFMVGVVARAFVPGTQQDQMLVLEAADGGEGKTAAVRIMGKAIDESAFLEGFSPSNDKDCFLKMRGKVLGEWGELAGFDKKESQWNKNFVTQAEDNYRDPYGALNKTWKRTISFVATSNSDDYLKESGGMRRYWPIKVGFVDLVALKRDMAQLWGEAVRLYQSGFQFWIDKTAARDARFRNLCDIEQRGRLVATQYDDMVGRLSYELVAGIVAMPDDSPRCGMRANATGTFTVAETAAMLYGAQYDHERESWRKEWNMMTQALKRCGWINANLSGNRRGWRMSDELIVRMRALVNADGPQPTDEMLAEFSKLA